MIMKNLIRSSQSGFTLIEVMITGVILTIALLSISGLQTTATNIEVDSYQRAHAMVVVDDMIARMNANRANAASYVTGTSSFLGTGDSQPATCTGTGVTLDQCEWSNLLKGSSVTVNSQAQSGLHHAIGCVVTSSTANEYFVIVAWQGQNKSGATLPSSCGSGVVSTDDAYRRVMVRGMQVATLTNLVVPTTP